MKEFCTKYGLEMVKELYYGKAKELFDSALFLTLDDWRDGLLKVIEDRWVHDQNCPWNKNTVPAEGVVVRVDHLEESESYKMKNFKFLESETRNLDAGITDMETNESEE